MSQQNCAFLVALGVPKNYKQLAKSKSSTQ